MRDTIIGVVLGILLIAGLFGLAKTYPATDHLPTTADIAGSVEPGFVGAKQIGAWILACPKGAKTTSATAADAFGRCRISLAYRRKDNPSQVILLLTMRLLGPAQHLAVLVIMPPLVKTGDELDLHSGPKMLKIPVSACKANRCVALAALSTQGENQLLAGASGVLVFPAEKTGKRGAIGVPFAGLHDAIGAMRRADI